LGIPPTRGLLPGIMKTLAVKKKLSPFLALIPGGYQSGAPSPVMAKNVFFNLYPRGILVVPTGPHSKKKRVFKQKLTRAFQKRNAQPQNEKELMCMVTRPPNTPGNSCQVITSLEVSRVGDMGKA